MSDVWEDAWGVCMYSDMELGHVGRWTMYREEAHVVWEECLGAGLGLIEYALRRRDKIEINSRRGSQFANIHVVAFGRVARRGGGAVGRPSGAALARLTGQRTA